MKIRELIAEAQPGTTTQPQPKPPAGTPTQPQQPPQQPPANQPSGMGTAILKGVQSGLGMNPNNSFATGALGKTLGTAMGMRNTAAAITGDPREAHPGDDFDQNTLNSLKVGTTIDHPQYGQLKVSSAGRKSVTFIPTKNPNAPFNVNAAQYSQWQQNMPRQQQQPQQQQQQQQQPTATQTSPTQPKP